MAPSKPRKTPKKAVGPVAPPAAKKAAKTPPRPLAFVEFCQALGVELRPGQRVLCRVSFDGVEPRDLPPEEREIAEKLFGPVDTIPPGARAVVAWIAGARSGKSFLGAVRLLHLCCTVDLSRLGPGERGEAPIVAPDLSLARQVLGYVRGLVERCEPLRKRLVSDTTDEIVLARENGQQVSITCRAASAKGRTGRGRSLVAFVMDESALFYDSDHKVCDQEIYRALAPRLIAGGQGMVISTPWGESGLLYDTWKDNFAQPTYALVARAATLWLRDEPHIRAQVQAEEARDGENARREFWAEWLSSDGSSFFSPAALRLAVDRDAVLGLPPEPGDEVLCGADLAFRSDASALVVVHRRRGVYHVAEVIERKPAPGQRLSPSDLAEEFSAVVRRHNADTLCCDQHSFDAFCELCTEHGVYLTEAPGGQSGKVEMYSTVRQLLRAGALKLPDHPRLVRQLGEVSSRPTSGGGLSISSPRSAGGGHGDLVSALVHALSQASGSEVEAPEPEAGSLEAELRAHVQSEQAFLERHRQQVQAEQQGQWWGSSGGDTSWCE